MTARPLIANARSRRIQPDRTDIHADRTTSVCEIANRPCCLRRKQSGKAPVSSLALVNADRLQQDWSAVDEQCWTRLGKAFNGWTIAEVNITGVAEETWRRRCLDCAAPEWSHRRRHKASSVDCCESRTDDDAVPLSHSVDWNRKFEIFSL